MSLENNIRKSFAGVRKDILEIKNQMLRLAESLEKIEAQVSEMKKRPVKRKK